MAKKTALGRPPPTAFAHPCAALPFASPVVKPPMQNAHATAPNHQTQPEPKTPHHRPKPLTIAQPLAQRWHQVSSAKSAAPTTVVVEGSGYVLLFFSGVVVVVPARPGWLKVVGRGSGRLKVRGDRGSDEAIRNDCGVLGWPGVVRSGSGALRHGRGAVLCLRRGACEVSRWSGQGCENPGDIAATSRNKQTLRPSVQQAGR